MDNLNTNTFRLSISIDNYLNNSYFQLVNQDLLKVANLLFSTHDLSYIQKTSWFQPLLQNDHLGLFDMLNEDQQMVVLYFYLKVQLSSDEIMFQWFMDTECNETVAGSLIELIHSARISKEESNIDIFQGLRSSVLKETEMIDLESILQLIKAESHIHWTFDSLPEITRAGYKNINLKQLKESAFLIEDHSCIVFGFSNNFTSFVELMANNRSNLLKQLCALVPIYYRDIYSLGRLFKESHEFDQILFSAGIRDILFYGLNENGKLTEFSDRNMIQYNHSIVKQSENNHFENDFQKVIPLYAKFIK